MYGVQYGMCGVGCAGLGDCESGARVAQRTGELDAGCRMSDEVECVSSGCSSGCLECALRQNSEIQNPEIQTSSLKRLQTTPNPASEGLCSGSCRRHKFPGPRNEDFPVLSRGYFWGKMLGARASAVWVWESLVYLIAKTRVPQIAKRVP